MPNFGFYLDFSAQTVYNVLVRCETDAENAMQLIYFCHGTNGAHPLVPHKILFHELTIVRSGEVEYFSGKTSLKAASGDIVYLTPGTLRSRRAGKNTDYFSFNFYLDDAESPLSFPPLIKGGNTVELSMMLSACSEIHERSGGELSQLANLFKCVLERLKYNLQSKEEDSLVAQIKRYIRAHLSENLTLKDISAAMHFSAVYCSSVFKRATGQPIISYCLDEKLTLAKELMLENTDLKEIAEKTGFSDYNYFSRLFKKRTGYTPSIYKSLFIS